MRKKRTVFLIVVIVLLLVGAAAKLYSDRYVWFAGESIPRDSVQIDISGKQVSVSRFERLQRKMPQCEIIWDVPFQGATYPSTSRQLQVTTLTDEDVTLLQYFPELTWLDARDCTDYMQLQAAQALYPTCTVRYQVALSGGIIENDAKKAVLKNQDMQELEEQLPYLPELTQVTLCGELPEVAELMDLQQTFPQINIVWELSVQGAVLKSTDDEANLSGKTLTYDEAVALFSYLPEVKLADMRDCSLTDQEMMALADTYSDCFFVWNMTIGELKIPTDAEEVDISGQVLESTEEIESLLPYFRNVTKVIMSHCGFDDETMDALNKRYDDIRFVWSVKIDYVYVRTDATYFYPYKFDPHMTVDNEDLYPLRYCTDMISIDIGHMIRVKNCEWAAFMPNLKYLILAETAITDITPLSGLKNLLYLEIWGTRITDYSPLLGCTSLEDLNLCKTRGDCTPIMQMTWLKHLWWGRCYTNAPQVLPAALPNTEMRFKLRTCCRKNGWRQLQNYYDMRDLMGMFYLP